MLAQLLSQGMLLNLALVGAGIFLAFPYIKPLFDKLMKSKGLVEIIPAVVDSEPSASANWQDGAKLLDDLESYLVARGVPQNAIPALLEPIHKQILFRGVVPIAAE